MEYYGKKKCDATGKTTYETNGEAMDAMVQFRRKWKMCKYLGKRVKHRQGKPAQKRVYPCKYCGGYHLTKYPKKYHNHEFDKADFIERT